MIINSFHTIPQNVHHVHTQMNQFFGLSVIADFLRFLEKDH